MKVDKVQPNYSVQNKAQNKANNYKFVSQQVSFKGSIGDKITDSLKHKGVLKFLKGLEWLKGESGGILITAVGTGAVAPWFIAFNPFVKAKEGATKEEKKEVQNTKIYTAMRQPISAVLAIMIQLGILTPIDRGLDGLINKEEYAKNFRVDIDQSELNTKSFITRKVEKEMAKEGIKKPSIFSVFKDGVKKYRENSAKYDEILNSRVRTAQNNQISKIAKKFRATGEIKVGERHIAHSSVADLMNKQIDDYIKDATDLKIPEKGMDFYSKRAKVLIENESYLAKIFKEAPADEAELKTYFENLLSKEKNADIKEIIQEIIDKPQDLRKSRMKRTLDRIVNIKNMCKGNYSEENYKKAMIDRNAELDKIIEKLGAQKIKKTADATKETIQNVVENVSKICSYDKNNSLLHTILHDTDTFHEQAEEISKKMYKDVTKKYKKFVENSYKSFNQPLKVLIGVFITLPITCNLLNWVYPRFMNLVFPKLAGVKKGNEEGGKKCQA